MTGKTCYRLLFLQLYNNFLANTCFMLAIVIAPLYLLLTLSNCYILTIYLIFLISLIIITIPIIILFLLLLP